MIRRLLKSEFLVLCENNLINELPGRSGALVNRVRDTWWGPLPRNKEIGDVQVEKLPVQPLGIWALP